MQNETLKNKRLSIGGPEGTGRRAAHMNSAGESRISRVGRGWGAVGEIGAANPGRR